MERHIGRTLELVRRSLLHLTEQTLQRVCDALVGLLAVAIAALGNNDFLQKKKKKKNTKKYQLSFQITGIF